MTRINRLQLFIVPRSPTPSCDAHAIGYVVDCCGVTRATPVEDRRGVDYWVITPSGRVGLDLKLRRRDYAAGGEARSTASIELDGHGSCGWLLKPGGAHLILFACSDSHRVALFEKRALQTAVVVNLSRWLADGRRKGDRDSVGAAEAAWKSRAVDHFRLNC